MVGKSTGARYLAQLKLSSFSQNSKGRLSLLGLRLVQTQEANIRLFFQIWNSELGTIVWEGAEELNYAWDTTRENPVTFQLVVEEIARNLITKLPNAEADRVSDTNKRPGGRISHHEVRDQQPYLGGNRPRNGWMRDIPAEDIVSLNQAILRAYR
jgi:hypothetical protein